MFVEVELRGEKPMCLLKPVWGSAAQTCLFIRIDWVCMHKITWSNQDSRLLPAGHYIYMENLSGLRSNLKMWF